MGRFVERRIIDICRWYKHALRDFSRLYSTGSLKAVILAIQSGPKVWSVYEGPNDLAGPGPSRFFRHLLKKGTLGFGSI